MNRVFPAATMLVAALSAAAHAQRSDTVVKMAAAPVHAGIATLHDDLSIGQAAGAPEYRFTNLTEVTPAPDGSVVVAQQGGGGAAISVRQYDAQGKYTRTLGRPGQYRRIGGVTALPDGRVAVIDNELLRLDVYAPDGKIVAAWSTGETSVDPGIGRLSADDAGNVYLKISLGATPSSPYTVAYLRLDPKTGHVLDTLRVPAAPQMPLAMLSHKVSATGPAISGVAPLTPRFVTTLSRQGYWITGRSDQYAVDLRLPTKKGTAVISWKPGSPITSIRRTAPAVPFSDDERKAVRATTERFFAQTDPGWKWNGPQLPRIKPNFNHFATGVDGRIWVMVYDAAKHYTGDQLLEADRDAATLWDVYEPDGRFLGQVRTEHGIVAPLSRGDSVWMIRHDAKAGELVVRTRIAWGG